MERLLTWLRSLGNAGAVHNASDLLEQRRSEERAVQDLVLALPDRDPAHAA